MNTAMIPAVEVIHGALGKGPPESFPDFEGSFQFDGNAERETGNADHRSDTHAFFAEDIAKEIGRAVRDTRVGGEGAGSGHVYPEPDHARDAVERPQIILQRRESVEGCDTSRLSPGLRVQLSPDPANVDRLMIDHGQHAAEKKQLS